MTVTRFWLLTLISSALSSTQAAKGLPKDCSEVSNSKARNGWYRIDPDGKGEIRVFCDMKTDGGGWTVFQRRIDDSVDFSRSWDDYKIGFGNKGGKPKNFWLVNENLHRLTANRAVALRVELEAWRHPHKKFFTIYKKFSIGDEESMYRLTVGKGKGTAGDALRPHNSMPFSTKDKDNDRAQRSNCAERYKGGWWYKSCFYSNLNGEYIDPENIKNNPHRFGIAWRKKKLRNEHSLKFSELKLRPAK